MGILQSIEFKVGLLVVGVASLIAFMSMQVSEDPSYLGRSQTAWFLLSDAGGLVKNSSVKMAGIPMGIIKDIRYQEGKARIDMVIKSDVKLTKSASVEVRAVGILGDKYVEIFPGFPADPALEDGEQILNVKDRGSIDNLISQVTEITNSLGSVAKTLRESVEDEGNRKHVLGRIVSNIERITADISDITGENKEKIGAIVEDIHNVTSTLDELINKEGDDGFRSAWKSAVASLKRVDKSLKNIEEITDKVNNGQGTIGKLINDDTTVEELNTAIEGVSSFMGDAGRISTALDFHSEYLADAGEFKTYAGVKIQPGLDRYYLLQVVDSPEGTTENTVTKTTTGGATTEVEEEKRFKNKIKMTAMFAKNFYDFTARGGIIENTGGMGFDYYFFRERIKLSLDLFSFSDLNMRASAQYQFWKGFYFIGGVNDALNNSSSYSSYLGLGLSLTNDDLKMFASKVSF